jgi:hypothetical protein
LARPKTANIAMNTQNECTAPAIAIAAEPNSRPPIRLMRAPVRSMKKPTGVCDTAETRPKVVSARLSSV